MPIMQNAHDEFRCPDSVPTRLVLLRHHGDLNVAQYYSSSVERCFSLGYHRTRTTNYGLVGYQGSIGLTRCLLFLELQRERSHQKKYCGV